MRDVTVRVRDVKELGFEGGATVTVGYQNGSAVAQSAPFAA